MLMASITRPAKAIGSRLPLDEFESQHASTTRRRGLPDRSGRAWAEVCQSALARHLRSHTLIRQGRQVASSADVQSRDQILCLSGPACVSAKLVGGACPPKSRPLMRLPSHTPEQTTFGAAVSLSFLGGEGKERKGKGKERKEKERKPSFGRERERERWPLSAVRRRKEQPFGSSPGLAPEQAAASKQASGVVLEIGACAASVCAAQSVTGRSEHR